MNRTNRFFVTAILLISFPVLLFAQPANDPCSGAIALTSSTVCVNTAGTLNSSTYTPPLTGCGATNKSDVWYSFVAQSSNQTLTLSSAPAQVRVQLFSGSCASLTSIACGNAALSAASLLVGTTYLVRVYTQNNSGGTFNICITHAPPANDDCAGAISLTSNSSCINTAGTLNSATATAGLPAGCQPVGTHYDVWYSFVAAMTTETVTISGLGANITNPRIQLYSGACGALTSLTCGTTSLTNASLTVGNTYYVRVSNLATNPSGSGTVADFNICVTHVGPVNDDCSAATALTSSTSCVNTAGTLLGSTYTTISSIGCGITNRNDVWYSFVAQSTNPTITLSSAPANPRIQLFSGSCGTLASVACGTSSLATTGLTIGATYLVRIYTDPNASGTFNICITDPPPPANDTCAGAITLVSGTSCVNTAGTLVSATYTAIPGIGCGVANRNDVWYSFVAQSTNPTITLSSAPANPRIQLFSGTCGSLTSVSCSAAGVLATSGLTVGATYLVRIYTDPNISGTFNICITDPAPPANDDCAGAISLTSGSACLNTAGTLNSATITAGLPAGCEAVGNHYDVWYKFVAAATTETITISGLGANISNPEIQLYSGTCGALVSLQCAATSITRAGLVVGTTYYVRVSQVGTSPSGAGTVADFNICVTHTGLVNDLCAGAIMLTSGFTCVYTAGTVANATVTSTASTCSGPGVKYDVWFSFVAQSASPTITLSAVGANFVSPKIELFAGSCAGGTVDCAAGLTLTPITALTIGTTYYVRIFSTTNPIPTTNAGFNICITDPSPPANDACSGAISLSSAATCVNTAGTLFASTPTAAIAAYCGNASAGDVWYSFVAQVPYPRITLSSIGTDFNTAGPRLQLFSGSCGSLVSEACVSTLILNTATTPGGAGLTVGATYYIRVFSNAATSTGSGVWTFNICITEPASTAIIDYGKSYINITKGTTGGSVEPGDELEIRATFVVRNGSGSVDSVAYYDTLENNSGFTYIANSIATRTNEGKIYKAFLDPLDTDAGITLPIPSTSDLGIQMNIGIGATSTARGRLNNTSKPSIFGNTCIILATYRVQVNAGYDTKINWGGGRFSYRDMATGTMRSVVFPNDTLMVYVSPGLCSNALSTINKVGIETDGTFGTPSNPPALARNRGTSTAVPSYTYAIFRATGAGPNDYFYGITNNTSSTYTTNNTLSKPVSGYRTFNLWDIIGDHTGATNTARGNNPCDTTLPVSTTNPCGYMLVVNSAYKTDTAFQSTITNLCPNTYYEISAWIRNVCYKCGCDSNGTSSTTAGYIPFAANDSSGVQPNLTFQVDGIDYYSTGNIPYTGTGPGITQGASDSVNQWLKRGFVYKTQNTQTSFNFLIRNNAPGGGGNDWAIDDIVVSTCLPVMSYSPSLNPTVCDSNSLVIYDTIRSSYENYTYYKWQRSTDAGASWTDITGPLGPATPFWNGSAWQYVASYTIPPANTTTADSADLYRMIVATTPSNLGDVNCQFTETVNIISLDVIDCLIPLNIDLLSFRGKLASEHAVLSWSTSKEPEPVTFEVEKSYDGINFHPIASLNSYHNYTSERNDYTYTDPTAVKGNVWYRIVMTNNSSRRKYTRTILLNTEKSEFTLSHVINPFSNELVFAVDVPADTRVDVSLLDMFGKTVKTKSYTAYSGSNSLVLNNTESLASGIYVLQVKNKEILLNRKVVKR